MTEPKYFQRIKARWHSPRVHIEVMNRDDASESSPSSVLSTLDRFARQFMLRDGDQLWLVIDRDSQSWKPKEMAEVGRACQQKNYYLAVSNPCFELWLLLHFEDVAVQDEKRRNQVLENKTGFLKRELSQHFTSDCVSRPLDSPYRSSDRTREDTRQEARRAWPSGLGTRVYRLVEQLQPKKG